MRQKYILGGSIVLTLVLLGTALAVINFSGQKENAASSADVSLQTATREAAYQDVIAQANRKIEALNEKVVALQDGKDLVSGQETISAKEAIEFARQKVNAEDYLLNIPELAKYQKRTVFEVSFTSGTVYVDAFNGEVVYSNVPVKINSDQAIQIAGQYLNASDLSKASVQSILLEGSEFYKVTINNYILYIDAFGNINKVQVVQYAPQQSSASTSSSSHREEGEAEHESEDN